MTPKNNTNSSASGLIWTSPPLIPKSCPKRSSISLCGFPDLYTVPFNLIGRFFVFLVLNCSIYQGVLNDQRLNYETYTVLQLGCMENSYLYLLFYFLFQQKQQRRKYMELNFFDRQVNKSLSLPLKNLPFVKTLIVH